MPVGGAAFHGGSWRLLFYPGDANEERCSTPVFFGFFRWFRRWEDCFWSFLEPRTGGASRHIEDAEVWRRQHTCHEVCIEVMTNFCGLNGGMSGFEDKLDHPIKLHNFPRR